jgi:hypothetical protein
VSLVPRNAPCPCGSGLKYKRCCLDREPELVQKAEALEILSGLGAMFPLMRPCGGELEEWLRANATPEPDAETIEMGLSRLTRDDRRTFVGAYASQYPESWDELVRDAGGEEAAEDVAIAGALGAALCERRTPNPVALVLLDRVDDPAEQLALAIDATNLWSIDEATALDEMLAGLDEDLGDEAYEALWTATVAEIAARLWTDRHERRLDVLVERLRGCLAELERTPRRMLERACATYERDASMRRRLGTLLLSDTLGPLFALSRTLAAAA